MSAFTRRARGAAPFAAIVVAAALAFVGCSSQPAADAESTPAPSETNAPAEASEAVSMLPELEVMSSTVTEGEEIPLAQRSAIFGVEGAADLSPQISWSGAPEETQSYVVTVFDPDAPTKSGFWHWIVANVPADVTEIAEGAGTPDSGQLPAGAITVANDAGFQGYLGAAPPDKTHEYEITVTAVNVPSFSPEQTATPALLDFYVGASAVAQGTIVVPATPGEGE